MVGNDKVVDERLAVSAVWREALAIISRYPFATIVPALVLAALADAPYYFLEASGFGWEQILTFMTATFAYYLCVAYAEEVAVEAERGADRITAGGLLRELRQAARVVPPVIVASVAAITIPTAATGQGRGVGSHGMLVEAPNRAYAELDDPDSLCPQSAYPLVRRVESGRSRPTYGFLLCSDVHLAGSTTRPSGGGTSASVASGLGAPTTMRLAIQRVSGKVWYPVNQ